MNHPWPRIREYHTFVTSFASCIADSNTASDVVASIAASSRRGIQPENTETERTGFEESDAETSYALMWIR